ncbi:hypothetical protein GGS26DRAFT_13557 [Hypomontagnella submonticulosa]|nr:hypothetical protein GGS26DRAFT_13557 [Hypomontagnella submonticulosa]
MEGFSYLILTTLLLTADADMSGDWIYYLAYEELTMFYFFLFQPILNSYTYYLSVCKIRWRCPYGAPTHLLFTRSAFCIVVISIAYDLFFSVYHHNVHIL